MMTAHILKYYNEINMYPRKSINYLMTYILSSYIPPPPTPTIHIENRDDAHKTGLIFFFVFCKTALFEWILSSIIGHVCTCIRTCNERALLVIVAGIIRDDLHA